MDFDGLKVELDTDPDARGYAGMSDQAAAADLNLLRLSRVRSRMLGSEIPDAVDHAEYAAKTDAEKDQVLNMAGVEDFDPSNSGFTRDLLVGIFGGGSVTIGALVLARTENYSKGSDFGFSPTKAGHVQFARSLP